MSRSHTGRRPGDTGLVFDLKEIAPPGLLGDQRIKFYVSTDPLNTS